MKKKILSLLIVAMLAVSAFAVAGCSEIENGSKIERMIVTLAFYDADNELVEEKDVQIKLYTNFAPKTVAAFKKLCEDGFYNGTCVYNIQSNWLEFGKYEFGSDGKLSVTGDYKNAAAIAGEFEKNGWKGNKLSVSRGAIIMKRDYDDEKVEGQKYDTAKGAVIVALGSPSNFSADKYCVFGMVDTDDIDSNPSSEQVDSSLVNLSGISSYGIIYTVRSLRETDEGTVTYYYDRAYDDAESEYAFEAGYYTKAEDDEGNNVYYRGTTISDDNMIEGDEETAFIKLLGDQSAYFYVLPYTRVIVKSIVAKK